MDQATVLEKWAEADSLVASVAEPQRSAAKVAVMTALLLEGRPSPDTFAKTSAGMARAPSSISSVRQLSRYTRRKGITGPQVVLLLAWFTQSAENRGITAKDCRAHWSVLADGVFVTTFIHRAETKGWLNKAQKGEEDFWELSGDGYD